LVLLYNKKIKNNIYSPVSPKMRIVDGAKSNDIANVALFMLRI